MSNPNQIRDPWNELQPLFRPKAIAVIGASLKPGPGLQVIENLHQLGYTGKIFPINPKYPEIAGHKCYASLTAVKEAGEEVDMVAILLGRERIIPVLEEAASIGVKAAWAFAAGFGELDELGKKLEKQLIDVCNKNNIHFV